jgi:hypothetical protein
MVKKEFVKDGGGKISGMKLFIEQNETKEPEFYLSLMRGPDNALISVIPVDDPEDAHKINHELLIECDGKKRSFPMLEEDADIIKDCLSNWRCNFINSRCFRIDFFNQSGQQLTLSTIKNK